MRIDAFGVDLPVGSWRPCALAGSVTLLAGALVLAGALATAQRRRIKQAVILKTLGATRPPPDPDSPTSLEYLDSWRC